MRRTRRTRTRRTRRRNRERRCETTRRIISGYELWARACARACASCGARRSPRSRRVCSRRTTPPRLGLVRHFFAPRSRPRARRSATARRARSWTPRARGGSRSRWRGGQKKRRTRTTTAFSDVTFVRPTATTATRPVARRGRRSPACCWGNASVSPATAKISSISSPRKTTSVARRRRAFADMIRRNSSTTRSRRRFPRISKKISRMRVSASRRVRRRRRKRKTEKRSRKNPNPRARPFTTSSSRR